jgi:ferrochelatase
MTKKIILLVNTGTPDKPEKRYVRRFLSEFLNDPRVIDIPWLFRKILVNFIIVPFRTSKSTSLYKKLWTDRGSPLLFHMENLGMKLRNKLGDDYNVVCAMRYGNPSLNETLKVLETESIQKIIVFPLYPHYSSSTTGSVNELIMDKVRSWNSIPEIVFLNQFYSNPSFIDVWTNSIKRYNPERFDHVLFSYHGLPLSHIQKSHPEFDFSTCNCEEKKPDHAKLCYKAACYETTRLIAKSLNIEKGSYSTSFQSRLTKRWLAPFTDQELISLISKGKRKVLVVAPSFVADCLETTIEINDTYKKLFLESGGEELILAESLNDNDEWVEAIKTIAAI